MVRALVSLLGRGDRFVRGSWTLHPGWRSEEHVPVNLGKIFEGRTLFPELEFPQDTALNSSSIGGAKRSFPNCFAFVFHLKSLKKVTGSRQLEKRLSDLVSVFLWNYCALQLLLPYTDGYCWFPSVR